MKKHLSILALAVILLSSGMPILLPHQELKFKNFKLSGEGNVDAVIPVDINQGGLQDLIVQVGKELRIFYQSRERGFKVTPDQTFRLPDNAFLWYLGKLAGSKPLCVMVTTSTGVVAYKPDKWGVFSKEPQELITMPHLFKGRAGKPPLYFDFVPDINGDGLSDVLLFDRGRLLIFLQDAKGEFSLKQKLHIETETSGSVGSIVNEKISEKISIPSLAFFDVKGSGRKDIVYYKDGELHVFLQNADGTFQSQENIHHKLEGYRKRANTYIRFELPPVLADFNGDGILDVAFADASKGKVYIFYGRKDRQNFNTPDDIKDMGGWIPLFWFRDMRGIGKQDLIIASIEKLNVFSGLDVFLTKKIPVRLHIFPFRKDGYDKEPVQTLTFSVPYVLRVTREIDVSKSFALVFTPTFQGDYRGIGVKDILVKAPDTNELLVYYGRREGGFEGTPHTLLKYNPPAGTTFTEATAADLNGDGRSDIILRHVNWDEGKSTIEVFLSEK